jgi:hypothetical protein
MRQRFDARGVNGLHLLDQRENAVQFVERIGRLLVVEIELRQFGQARNIGEGQGHGGSPGGASGSTILKMANNARYAFSPEKAAERLIFRVSVSQFSEDYKVECRVNGCSDRA